MSIKDLGPPNWIDFIKSALWLLILVGGTIAAAGDFRWLTITDHDAADFVINQKINVASAEQTKALKAVATELASFRINDLDSEITFLKIKVEQGEASKSEQIILPRLELRLRELQRAAEAAAERE